MKEELLKKLSFTIFDMQEVGDHYWGGDYFPEAQDLMNLAHSINLMLENKIDKLSD